MANGGFAEGIQDARRRRDADLTERWRKADHLSIGRAESVVVDLRVADGRRTRDRGRGGEVAA